jgi:N-acetyl-gamma-glutamylphosphate reductase
VTSVGIIGASGFTGAELLRLCAQHPQFDVKLATGDTQAGAPVADVYPSLAGAYGDMAFDAYASADQADGLDLVFVALPHGASQAVAPDLLGRVGGLVDLAADFRLTDPALYPTWYGSEHTRPDLLGRFAFGLPELFRPEIAAADVVAAPGCYVTAATLALAPLLRAGLIAPTGIIVDAASGASGAGRGPKPTTTFCTIDEDFTAYGLLTHRHTPEIEQALTAALTTGPAAPARGATDGAAPPPARSALAADAREAGSSGPPTTPAGTGAEGAPGAGASAVTGVPTDTPGAKAGGSGTPAEPGGVQVLFTPHMAPMNRGILATCYARPTEAVTTAGLLEVLNAAWQDEPFVVAAERSPSTKATLGSNAAHVTVRADQRTGWVVAIAALDNLVKGASGQAIQCANILADLPESTGLPTTGLYP